MAGALFVLGVVGSVAICHKVEFAHSEVLETRPAKQYSHELAENVRYYDLEFIDRELFTFKNCRIRKLSSGAITFGAFNVIEFDGLIINIPAEGGSGSNLAVNGGGAHRETNTFSRVFTSFKTMGKRRFSGIKINQLVINKYLSEDQFVRIDAQRAESSFKRTIVLKHCYISTNNQSKMAVSDAYIEFGPDPVIRCVVDDRKILLPLH